MSSSDVSSVTKYFVTANEGFNTTLGSTISAGATSVGLNSTSGLTNGSVFVGIIEPGVTAQQVFTGTVDVSGSQITNVVWTRGTNVGHAAGVTIVDYSTGTARNMATTGILKQHTQAGAHTGITTDTIATTGAATVGGALAVTGTTTLTGATTITALSNPYKFSVYRNSALSMNTGFAVVQFDTKLYDTGSNIDVATNKGRFTAPVAGFYQFGGQISIQAPTVTANILSIYKNGSEIYRVNAFNAYTGTVTNTLYVPSAPIQLAANDYIELFFDPQGTTAVNVGSVPLNTFFSGFLVSAT